LNLRMVAYVWLTWRDRRVHRRRLLDYIWRMRYVRDWWLLDHAEGSATTTPCIEPGRFEPRIGDGTQIHADLMNDTGTRIDADPLNDRGSVGCQ
jgi:hypothetical protein